MSLLLGLLGGCERSAPAPRGDSAVTPATAVRDSTVPARDRSGWNPAAGPALLVGGATLDEAIVLYPFAGDTVDESRLDSASANGGVAMMFGRGGARFSATLGALPDNSDDQCERWLLRDLRPSSPGSSWAIGFVQARAVPVALDSVDVLSARDSVALAAEASRLASAVTAVSGPSFQGLRFTAHDIRRFDASPGVQAIIAHMIRHVNQEANPQEEQTLLIAERDSGVTAGPYRLVYAERAFGREEQVATPEVIGGARLGGSSQPTLVVAHDSDTGIVYTMIERTGTRRWRVRWTSPVAHCD